MTSDRAQPRPEGAAEHELSPALRRGWQIGALALLAICLFFAWQSWELALFDRLGPGAGFFPFWLSLIGAGLCIALLVEARPRRAGAEPAREPERLLPRGRAAGRVLAIVAALALAAALIEPLGYRLTALLFLAGLLPALGARAPLAVAVVALLGSFGVYVVFNDWLDVVLPVGWFGV